jgi:hypothetical protein
MIGQELRARYKVPQDLPHEMLTLLMQRNRLHPLRSTAPARLTTAGIANVPRWDPNRKFRDDGRVPCFGGPTDIDEPAAYDFHYIDLDQHQSINLASTFSGHACSGESM